MKATNMTARFGAAAFGKVALVAAAICMAATSALADVANLENYRFRYDFSKGKNNFINSATQSVVGNFVGTSIVAVEGPNGANDAVHVSGTPWSAFNNQSVLNSDWTFAMSVKFGNTEGGILMGIGRLPQNGSKQIAICSSSDKSKLYLRELSRPSSTHTTAGSYTLTELGDVTQGYHTLVIVHKHSSDYKGTLYFYWDGVSKGSYTMKTGKPFGSSSSISGMQFGCLMTAGSGTFSNVVYVNTGSDTKYSFYDLRLYAGQFSAADVAAYAALYPCTYPFRPNAYVEANGCNAIDTGVKPSAAVRYLADFQYLDTLGGRRIFGTGSTGTDGEDASGQGVFADLYIDGSAASGGSFARALHGPYVADSTWIGLNVTADRFRRWFDLDGNNATSKLYDHNWTQSNTDNVTIQNLPAASDAENALSTRLFATQYAENAPTDNSTARIYTFEVYRSGTLEAFFAPTVDENGNAGFTNIVAGTFHGEEMESPARPLRFYNGLGCASDYKYENGTLFAKVYATAVDALGTMRVADGEAAVSANGWMPRGGNITISATPIAGYKFTEWSGDTGAIVSGYNVTDATIEVSGSYPLQLRATFERGAGYGWTGAAGDGKFSTPANWENLATGEAATEPPAPGTLLSFSAAAGGTITNDLENLGGADIVFPEGAGAYTITGNCFTNVANVINESASVQTLSNEVFFATTYNVALEQAVNFAGGAIATTAGTTTGAAGGTLTGEITFTGNWAMNASYTVPSGSRLAAQKVTGSGAALTINQGGYAHFASIQPGKNNTVWRINLNVNGVLEVDGNVDYWNSGSGGSVQAVSSSGGTGVIIAKGFYKSGGKQHLCTIKNIKIGAGSATSAPIFGATYGSNMLHFFQDITIQAMADIEFQSVYNSSMPKENGGISLHAGKTMTIKTEDDDGNPHTVIWGCSFCVKANSGNSWGYSTSNVRLSKQGKGTLIMRNRCSITGSTGYQKGYNGFTDVRGGTLRVEEKGQLGGSALTVYGGARFELANSVALPNNTTLSGGGNSIDIGNSASLKLTSSSGDNATITMGTGSTLTGNVSLGTNTTVTAGANAKITGNVTLGTNSTLTAGLGATIGGGLTISAGTVWNLNIDPESATPVGGAIKLTSGNATIKVSGDYSSLDSPVLAKVLGRLDSETDVANLTLDATNVAFPVTYDTRLKVQSDGEGSRNLVFHARRKTFVIFVK